MIDQHNSLAEKFIKKGFWLYLFSFIIAPISYTIKIIISGELTVSDVWILYWIISLITMISAYNDFGMSESINHFIPAFVSEKRYDKVKTILVYALITQMSTWIIIAWFFFFGADFIAMNYFKSIEAILVLKVFSIYFLGINLFQILSIFFISIQNTFLQKIVDFFRMFFSLFAVLWVFILDLSNLVNYSYAWIIWLYVWIIISIWFFYKNYYVIFLKNEKILWNKKMFKKIFNYAIMVFLWAQAATILSQIDMQMIIFLLWTTDAGYYTNYLSIIWIPFMIIGPIFWLLFPIFSEMHSKWEHNKIKITKSMFQKNFLAIWIAFNLLFFVFSETIAFILFWEKFIKSGTILQYSILLLVFNFLFQVNFNIMAWIGKVKERLKIISIAVLFNTIANIILINSIWVYGAALATSIWWVLIWILSEYYLGKNFMVIFDWKFLTKNIFYMWLLSIFLYHFIEPIFIGMSRLDSALLLSVISLIWFLIFWILNKNEFKFFILEIKKLKKWTS